MEKSKEQTPLNVSLKFGYGEEWGRSFFAPFLSPPTENEKGENDEKRRAYNFQKNIPRRGCEFWTSAKANVNSIIT